MRSTLLKAVVLAFIAVQCAALATAAPLRNRRSIEWVPVKYTDPTSGEQMYNDYCAVCHGVEGASDGPAVPFLNAPPPELRTLAQRNHGRYPAKHGAAVLRFGTEHPVQGAVNMPQWAPLFRATVKMADLRVYNLVAHVKTLQTTSP